MYAPCASPGGECARSEDQRAVLLLIAVEDLTDAEAAKVLNVPIGTVTSRLSRARDYRANVRKRTQLRIGGVLSYVAGWVSCPSLWEDTAMKASSLFVAVLAIAILSIARANAAPVHANGGNAPWVGCSWAGGWNFSSTPCRNTRNFRSYGECSTALTKLANTSLEKWWYCSSLGLKD